MDTSPCCHTLGFAVWSVASALVASKVWVLVSLPPSGATTRCVKLDRTVRGAGVNSLLQFKNWFIYFLIAFVVVTLRKYVFAVIERSSEVA